MNQTILRIGYSINQTSIYVGYIGGTGLRGSLSRGVSRTGVKFISWSRCVGNKTRSGSWSNSVHKSESRSGIQCLSDSQSSAGNNSLSGSWSRSRSGNNSL
jgi:hypothetical protein